MGVIAIVLVLSQLICAIIGLYYLYIAYFKVNRSKLKPSLLKLIGWALFIGCTIGIIQQIFWYK